MTAPDPALLAALASAPSIEPDPSQVGKVGVFLMRIECVEPDNRSPWPTMWRTDRHAWMRGDNRLVGILDPRDAEIARLRARVAELEGRT